MPRELCGGSLLQRVRDTRRLGVDICGALMVTGIPFGCVSCIGIDALALGGRPAGVWSVFLIPSMAEDPVSVRRILSALDEDCRGWVMVCGVVLYWSTEHSADQADDDPG